MKCKRCRGRGVLIDKRGSYLGECGFCNGTGEVPGWSPRIHGSVNGEHDVTFRTGLNENSGQTLISDGHVSRSQFDAHHNRYGDNDRSRYPDQPDRIEDSDAHKDDGAYTGPGH